jgi:hypothetical protein
LEGRSDPKGLERSLRGAQRMERSGTPESPVSGAGPGGSDAGNAPKFLKQSLLRGFLKTEVLGQAPKYKITAFSYKTLSRKIFSIFFIKMLIFFFFGIILII